MISEIITSFFIIVGTFFMLVASIGLVRLPDIYTRMHSLTKGATLGLVGLIIGAMILLQQTGVTIKGLLAIFFYFLTNPVGAHMIARAAYYHLRVPFWNNTIAKEWNE